MVSCRRKFLRFISLLTIISIMLATFVYAAPDGDKGASTESGVGTSFYDVSTALTAFASNVVGANVNDKHADTDGGNVIHGLKELENTKAGNAGAVIGYGDKEKGFIGYIAANETRSVTTSSYGAYLDIGDKGKAYTYARYGRLLNELGLDATGNASSSTAARLSGKAIQGGYLVASFVPKSCGLALSILKTLNPFRFLVDQDAVTVKTVTSDSLADKWGNGTLTAGDVKNAVHVTDKSVTADEIKGVTPFNSGSGFLEASLSKISKFTTQLYLIIRELGMFAILPLLFALLLFGIFSKWRPGQETPWVKILTFIERFAFIVLGIPILGMCYTSVLDNVSDLVEKQPPSARIVAATFVDFENWVKVARLEPPQHATLVSDGISEKEPQGKASADSWRSIRNTIYAINQRTEAYDLPADSGLGIQRPAGMSDDDFINYSENHFDTNAGMWDYNTGEFAAFGDAGKRKDLFNQLNALLNVFSQSEFYTASAWESNVNSTIRAKYESDMGSTQSTSEASSVKQTVYQMYFDTDEVNDWMNRRISENAAIFNKAAPPASGGEDSNGVEWAVKTWNIFANGSGLREGGFTSSDAADMAAETIRYTNDGSNSNNAIDPGVTTGLSTMSMYNYLSSAFNQSNIAVYSASNTTSEYTRQQHYSVNVAGSGLASYAFLLNAGVCLAIFCLLGIIYCFGMMFRNLKTGFSMIMAIPGAMVGILKSIAQVAVYVVSMIVELLTTMFLYQIVMELIMVFASIVEGPILDKISEVTLDAGLVGGLFANAGSSSLASVIAADKGLFMFALFAAIMLASLAGIMIFKIRKPFMTAWAYASIRLLRFVTMPEFVSVFDKQAAKIKSLYIWDELKTDVKQTAKDLIKDIPKKETSYERRAAL